MSTPKQAPYATANTLDEIARILAQHCDRGAAFGPGDLVTVICLCGAETSADDHRGINRHLAVEEVLARHQADVIAAFGRNAK